MVHTVGIIGYGLSAKVFHIPYILSLPVFSLGAICQRRPSPGNDASKDFPEAAIYSESTALINDSKIDLVILCTPPETHLKLAKECLDAGKHVVVEKPFCPTSAECDELINCAKKNQKILTVFHNRRWDVDYQTIISLLEKKTLGNVLDFESHFDRWSPTTVKATWQLENIPGHGVVYDLGSHLLDQIVYLFGLPKRVTGITSRQRSAIKNSPIDACTILLHYEDMLATVKCSAMSAEKTQLRFWVRGDKGSLKLNNEDPQEAQLIAGMKISDAEFGKPADGNLGLMTLVRDQELIEQPCASVDPVLYTQFYKQLASALVAESPAPVDAGDARNIIRLIELILESAKSGRTIDLADHKFR